MVAKSFQRIVDEGLDRSRIESFLEESGNDINYQDTRDDPPACPRKGWTFLHYAAFDAHVDTIKYLVSRGANVNITDSLGRTPLHYAVDFDYVVATQDGHTPTTLPTTESLINLGADVSIVDDGGRTPRDRLKAVGLEALFDQVMERAMKRRVKADRNEENEMVTK